MPVQVITMSTKGQVVLPSEMREALSLDAGSKLAVFCEDGTIMLKPLVVPSADDSSVTGIFLNVSSYVYIQTNSCKIKVTKDAIRCTI